MNDQTLADHADDIEYAGQSTPELSVEDVLAQARTVERTATICIRGDLLDRRDRIINELAGLIDPQGNVLDPESEASIGEVTVAAHVEQLRLELRDADQDIAKFHWSVRFRGLDSDAWIAFHKAHFPKGDKPDVTDFNTKLIAETAIAPVLTEDQVVQLRKKLGSRQIRELADKAWESCNQGGVDVPKSRSVLLKPTQG